MQQTERAEIVQDEILGRFTLSESVSHFVAIYLYEEGVRSEDFFIGHMLSIQFTRNTSEDASKQRMFERISNLVEAFDFVTWCRVLLTVEGLERGAISTSSEHFSFFGNPTVKAEQIMSQNSKKLAEKRKNK